MLPCCTKRRGENDDKSQLKFKSHQFHSKRLNLVLSVSIDTRLPQQ